MGNDAPSAETTKKRPSTSAPFSSHRSSRGCAVATAASSSPSLIACLLWYLAYVLLAGYAHDFMSTPVFGSINIGLLLGLAQIVTTFAVTMWYVSFANRRLDPLSAELRAELEPATGVTR